MIITPMVLVGGTLMSKERIQIISTESNFHSLESCPHCTRKLTHNYFTSQEMQEKEKTGLKIGTNQRLSICRKCKVQFINAK